MLRRALLAASASTRLRQLITTAPQTRAIVERYVAGETADDAVRVTRTLRSAGLLVTLDYLGEDTKDPAQAAAVTDEYIQLAGKLGADGLTQGGAAEISVKPTAVGLFLGTRTAKENISRICAAAHESAVHSDGALCRRNQFIGRKTIHRRHRPWDHPSYAAWRDNVLSRLA